MDNGLSRYYHVWDHGRKDKKGYCGVYSIIDRTTGKEVAVADSYDEAQKLEKELDKKDKLERGIKIPDMIEIPFCHRDRSRTVTEVAPVVIYK